MSAASLVPLAWYSLNSRWLSPLAREAARGAGLGPACDNPFRSIIVRAVETVYALEEALRLLLGPLPGPDRRKIIIGTERSVVPVPGPGRGPVVVIGVGNEFRRDDGAGPAVIRASGH